MPAATADATVPRTLTTTVGVTDRLTRTASVAVTAHRMPTGTGSATESETETARGIASASGIATGPAAMDGRVGEEGEAGAAGADRTTYQLSTARIGRWRRGWGCDGPALGTLLGQGCVCIRMMMMLDPALVH